jgi:hypothetical protein
MSTAAYTRGENQWQLSRQMKVQADYLMRMTGVAAPSVPHLDRDQSHWRRPTNKVQDCGATDMVRLA